MQNEQTVLAQRASNMALAMEHHPKKHAHVKVDLPENRHKWASNDQVEKPTVILRGPNSLIDAPATRKKSPKNLHLPTLMAYALSGALLITGFMYFYTEISSILK